MNKETCAYDRKHKVLANHHCCECGLPFCSLCDCVIPAYSIAELNGKEKKKHRHLCNECFQRVVKPTKIK